jgi:hypothetical protein
MIILSVLGIAYLVVGTIYALYILFFAGDAWYWLPVNILGGPIMLIYIFIKTLRGEKIHIVR